MNNEAYIDKMNIHWNNFLEECKTIDYAIDFNQWYADKLRFLKTPDEIDAFINHPKPLGMNNEASHTGDNKMEFGEPTYGALFFDAEGKLTGSVKFADMNKPIHTGEPSNSDVVDLGGLKFDEDAPRVVQETLFGIPVNELKPDKFYFDIGHKINDYCKEAGITTDQLIEQHRYWKYSGA